MKEASDSLGIFQVLLVHVAMVIRRVREVMSGKHSEERIKKRKISRNSRRILQFTLEGDFLAEFPSLSSASRSVDNRHPDAVRRCCIGTRKDRLKKK
eukprot:UN01531